MGKWWAALFGATMLGCLVLFIVAPFAGWWLPEGVSTHSGRVDALFYIILGITTFFFILTEALLVIFMWRFGGTEKKAHVFGHHAMEEKVFYTSFFKRLYRPLSALLHDQHRVELAWTLVPAVILLYIAFAQVNTWAEVKYRSRMPNLEGAAAGKGDSSKAPVQVAVSARQFEWRVRYPSSQRMGNWVAKKDERTINDFKSFPKLMQYDDVHVANEVHVVVNQPVIVQLSTLDVIHSFNLPNMRVKQDALPGQIIPVWFTPTKGNTKFNAERDRWEDGYNPDTTQFRDKHFVWDLACAELCGWGHYRMVGRLYVHESQQDLLNWLRKAEGKQNAYSEGAAPTK